MDVIVRTPAEVAHRLKIGDPFFREVMTKGQVLYERSEVNVHRATLSFRRNLF